MPRFATVALAALLVAGCNEPNQPEGEENSAAAAAMTAGSAADNSVVPPDAETQPGYGTENAAGDVLDPQDPGAAAPANDQGAAAAPGEDDRGA